MVLTLPLLMGIMGLIMVFGFVASWKVRSEVVARDVGWRMRNPRSNQLHPRSEEWPEIEDGELGLSASIVGRLDAVADQPVVQAPIIRGPLPEMNVNSDLLDLSRNLARGISTVDQPSQVMSEIGRVDYQTQNDFLTEELKYRPMGIGSFRSKIHSRARNYPLVINNFARRLPFLWETELDLLYDQGDVSGLIFAINEFRDPIVLPIDEDLDFYHWPRRFLRLRTEDDTILFEWQAQPVLPDPRSYSFITDYSRLRESDFDASSQRPFRFRPPTTGLTRLSLVDELREVPKWQYYEEGADRIRETVVEAYRYEIPGVPLRMVQATLRLYEKAIRLSEGTEENPFDHNEPKLTDQEKTQLRQWIADLRAYEEELRDKLEALRGS